MYTIRKIRQYVSCPKKNFTTTLSLCKKCKFHEGVEGEYVMCKLVKR